ncbi:MAG TPA: EAL domain-containing protein [Burkholderiales bacterium]|nr:EAL domain-containing protein [Burkholderiales bacterium]
MSMFARLSLKPRLALTAFLPALAAVAATCALAVAGYYQETRVRLLAEAVTRGELTVRETIEPLQQADARFARQRLELLRLDPEVLSARLFDTQGDLFAEYRSVALREAPPVSKPPRRAGQQFHPAYLETTLPVMSGDAMLGTLVLLSDLDHFRYDVVGFGVKLTLIAIVALLLGFVAMTHLQGRIVAPVSELAELMRQVLADKRYELRAQVHSADEMGALAMGFNAMLDRISDREATLHRELAERTQAQRRLEELAHFDPLTKLPNRHFFSRQLERALVESARSGSAGAVLLIDLRNFRSVNETFGHDAADSMLLQLSRRLTARLREDDMLCRLGGDEFALVLEQVSGESHIVAVVNKILSALREPIEVGDGETSLSACIGIAVFPVDGAEPHEVLRHAETALHRAKASGSDLHCFFAPDMLDRMHPRQNIEKELQRAVELGELRLHFQPQVRLSDGELRGLEALLRWQHPERGLLLPGDFISMAEENAGLMRAISDWTLNAVCGQIAAWRAAGFDIVPVAVNYTPAQLRDPNMVSGLEALLARYGVGGEYLELEITENLLMAEPRAGETLVALRALGMRIAVDDFGTGYSSLAYLKELPITTLKIDRGFVHGLPGSNKYAAVIRAIVGLATHLGFDTLAEGVETARQVDMLRAMGCTAYQGFSFSRAVPADEVEYYLSGSAQPVRRLALA